MPKNLKVLILRFSSIGDIVLTSPIFRCIKQQSSNTEIHFVTKSGFVTLMENNPNIDKIYSFKDSISEITTALKSENYDFIFDLHNNLRTRILKFKLGVKSFTFKKLNFEKWMMVNFKINRLPDIHIVDRYLNTLQILGIKNDGKGLDYFLPPNIEIALNLPKKYDCIAIGAAHFTKQIPENILYKIIEYSTNKIIILGGNKEKKLGEKLQEKYPQKVYNTCGKTTLHESAFLIKNCTKLITPDTGMMHIGAAFKKNIVTYWGNTIPELGMYPYLPDYVPAYTSMEVKNLACRPCSKIGFSKCPKNHFNCMNLQKIDY